MAEVVLQAKTLPEPLLRLIPTEKVEVRKEHNGEIRLVPIKESGKTVSNCPFLGMYSDGKLTVDGYLENKRAEKELEL